MRTSHKPVYVYAADWCRGVGVGRGDLVAVDAQDAGYSYVVYCVCYVARSWVVGSAVCVVYPQGKARGRRQLLIEGGVDYEGAWLSSMLFTPPPDVQAAVVAWLERPDG